MVDPGAARTRFSRGERIAVRSIRSRFKVVQAVIAATVVRDDDELTAAYLRVGAPVKWSHGRRGGPRGRTMVSWEEGWDDSIWQAGDTLALYRPGEAHSVHLHWAPGGQFREWYVNLEAPWRRTRIGFDFEDHELDLVIAPDRATWRWKDEDELEWLVEQGWMSAEGAAAVRAEGERALERVRRRAPPLDCEWEAWRPDPLWTLPSLPEGWDRWDP